jgi:hypothetical protein
MRARSSRSHAAKGEIIVAVALGWPDFENNGDHNGLPTPPAVITVIFIDTLPPCFG